MFRKVKIFLEMIKFEHTVFALPFAFIGALLGAQVMENRFPGWLEVFWILVAMVGARSAAMGLNRLIDKLIDLKNPRTAMRALPAGLLSSKEVILFIIISFILLFVAASQLQPLAMQLLPIAVFFLVFYSYTKRFTWLCHLVLGLTIGLAPLGAWVAVSGEISWTAIVLYLSIAFWIAGFDIIYATQDYQYDRDHGLYSIPARFGIAPALYISRAFHAVTGIGFISLFWLTDLSWVYLLGTAVALLILFYEHFIIHPQDMSRLNTAFFTMNGVLSMVLFLFTLVDLAVNRL